MKIFVTREGAIYLQGDSWELTFVGTLSYDGFGFIRFQIFPRVAKWARKIDSDDIPF